MLEGDAGMPVGKAAQQGLADDARQTAHGDEQPHVAVGEAALLQQRGLRGADTREHGPVGRLHDDVLQVQPPDGGHGVGVVQKGTPNEV